MLRIPFLPPSYLWYCVLAAAWSSTLAAECPSSSADALHEPLTGYSQLIQKKFAHTAPSGQFAKPSQSQPNGISLVSQDAGRTLTRNITSAAHAVDNATIDHDVHTSIFELSFAQLDRQFFWLVFAGMLLFTIFVDRAENWAQHKAAERASNNKFLTRINAELMMFGTVGLCLFVFSNIRDMPHDEQLIVEFVDILCSMGACGLIAIAAVLFATRSWDSWNWKRLEATNLVDKPIEPSGPVEQSFGKKHFSCERLTDMDYQVMATRFIINNHLPKEFVYSEYLDETLVGNSCDLMDVKFYTWIVLLVVVMIFYAIRYFKGDALFSNTVYITGFLVSNWLVFFGFWALVICANNAYSSLLREIRQDEQELQAADVKMGPNAKVDFVRRNEDERLHPFGDSWTRTMKFGMQLVALMNSFLCSFYIMHLQFNLQAANMAWWWRPLLLFPLLVSLFVMLPLLLCRFTAAEAYYWPDGDALESSRNQLTQLGDDLEYMRRRWEEKGRPEFPSMSGEGCNEKDFCKVLRSLGILMARSKVHRIFLALDEDKSGGVTTQELMKRLESQLILASKSLNSPMSDGSFTFSLSKGVNFAEDS